MSDLLNEIIEQRAAGRLSDNEVVEMYNQGLINYHDYQRICGQSPHSDDPHDDEGEELSESQSKSAPACADLE